MNLGSLGPVTSSAAGAPLAAGRGGEADRAQQLAGARERQAQMAEKAQNAAGIAAADGEEHETEERDADGRRLWEAQDRRPAAAEEAGSASDPPRSRDASGDAGNHLDLSG